MFNWRGKKEEEKSCSVSKKFESFFPLILSNDFFLKYGGVLDLQGLNS